MVKRYLFIVIIQVLFSYDIYSEPLTLRYFQTDFRHVYQVELLRLVMVNTFESDGPFRFKPIVGGMTLNRGLLLLEEGQKVNVGFLASSQKREARFLPVRIPTLRGILGYRVSLISRKRQAEFSKIGSLQQLKSKFTAGFGSQWADMEILIANKIPVIGVVKYDNLFKMLIRGRFDYFPRGISEAWKEVSDIKNTDSDLMVAPGFAFYYPYPVYYFVNKKNPELADRIERGLIISLKNGMFKKHFLDFYSTVIKQADLKNRKVFTLKNPTLPQGTPAPDTSWWLEQN